MKQRLIKSLLLILLNSCIISNSYAQEKTDDNNIVYIPKYQGVSIEQKKSGKTYINVDTDAWHEKGRIESFINNSKAFPQKARKENIQGNAVRLKFIVNSDGRIIDAEVVTSASPSLDAEAVKVIESIPRQSPAIKNGIKVPVEYYCDVSFEDEIKRPKNILETTGLWLPKYKGGIPALLKHLQHNLKYPRNAAENGVQGVVLIRFVVSSKGEVIKPHVLRKVSPSCDAEALRVVRGMKNWIPAVNNGEYVSYYFTLPIKFILTRN